VRGRRGGWRLWRRWRGGRRRGCGRRRGGGLGREWRWRCGRRGRRWRRRGRGRRRFRSWGRRWRRFRRGRRPGRWRWRRGRSLADRGGEVGLVLRVLVLFLLGRRRGLRLWLGRRRRCRGRRLRLRLGLGCWLRRRGRGLFGLRRDLGCGLLPGLRAGRLSGDLRGGHAPDRRLVPPQRLTALDAEVGVVGILVAVRAELHDWGSPVDCSVQSRWKGHLGRAFVCC